MYKLTYIDMFWSQRYGTDCAASDNQLANRVRSFIPPSNGVVLVLGPAEVFANQLVEALVVLHEEAAQLGDDRGVHARVLASLRLPQTLVRGVVPEAVEAFCLVEVEVSSPCQGIIGIYRMLQKRNGKPKRGDKGPQSPFFGLISTEYYSKLKDTGVILYNFSTTYSYYHNKHSQSPLGAAKNAISSN